MSINVYLMPSVGDGTGGSHGNPFRAKYWDDLATAGVAARQIRYGAEPVWMVIALDVPGALHATITADNACVTVPDLSQNVGAQLAQAKSVISGLNLPSQWIAAGDSWGSVCRFVGVFMFFFEAYVGQGGGAIFGNGVTLTTPFNTLDLEVRNRIRDTCDIFSLPKPGINANTALQAMIKNLADNWTNISLQFGEIVL